MYLGFRGLSALVGCLPLVAARALGRALGWLAYSLLRGQRRLVLTHLQSAFGEQLGPQERGRIARGVFRNLGHNVVEWLFLPRLSNAQIQQLIVGEGLEHLRQAKAKGEGALVITPHFGNWELISPYLRTLGFEGGVLARRLRYPEYESFLISLRGARGIPTLIRGSLKEIAKLLRANQFIGILPDQDVDSLDGIYVNFLGHPAYTPIGPAALSLMTGAPIIPCFLVRTGRTFTLRIEPPIAMAQTGDRAVAMAQITQAWSAVFESYIRKFPDHWVWMHRRWKTQPTASQGEGRRMEGLTSTLHPPPSTLQLRPSAPALLLVSCLLSLVSVVVGCAKSKPSASSVAPQTASAPPTDPNATQQMTEFALTGYEVDGSKRWELEGKGASVDGSIVTIFQPNGVGYEPERKSYLTASAAQVNQTNRHVRFEHDVTIHTSDGVWFTSPVLHWIPDQQQFATDQPVRMETDHMLLRGRGSTGHTQLKQMTVLEDIELVLNPTDHDLSGQGPKQVTITCDGPLSFDYAKNIATFEQNVHVKDPSGDLFSDTLIAYLDANTHTIRYAEAIGRVRIHQEQNTALSERAVYEPAIGKITLLGKPSLLVYPSQQQSPQIDFGGLAASDEEALP